MIIILKLTQNFQICTAQADTSLYPQSQTTGEGSRGGNLGVTFLEFGGLCMASHFGLDWDASSFSCFFLSFFPVPKVRTVL